MAYVIGGGCVDVTDRACPDVCPVDCIYVGERKSYINASECIDCGACEPECPVDAIFVDRTGREDEQNAVFISDSSTSSPSRCPGATGRSETRAERHPSARSASTRRWSPTSELAHRVV